MKPRNHTNGAAPKLPEPKHGQPGTTKSDPPTKRTRAQTQPGFSPTTTDLPDPECVGAKGKPCQRCHVCLRAKHGVNYWTKGVTR